MTTNRLTTPIGQLTPEPITTPIALPSQSRSVTRSVQASHGRTDGRTDEELGYLASESSRNASPAGGLQESTIPGQPDDLEEPRREQLYEFDTPKGPRVGWYVPFIFVEAFHRGTWSVDDVTAWRELRPIDAVSPPAPVVRPVGSPAARGAEVRALCDAATPGPWLPFFTIHGDPYVVPEGRPWPSSQIAAVSTGPSDYGRADAEFIAAARDLVPSLLDENERLRSRIAAVEALCDAADKASLSRIAPDFAPIEIPWTRAVRATLAEVDR